MHAEATLNPAALSSAARRARRLAQEVHQGQRNRRGTPMVDHVQRVAAAVPPAAQAVAFVHDVCERSSHSPADVAAYLGLTAHELQALDLLTKRDGETLLAHTQRVLSCPDAVTWQIAVAVKRADVADHINGTEDPGDYERAADLLARASR